MSPPAEPKSKLIISVGREQLRAIRVAAAERDVSTNWLVLRLVEEGMERLAPAEEFRLTMAAEERPS